MSMLDRRAFLQTGGALVAAAITGRAAGVATADAGPRPANVVLLMSDEHNPRYSSVHGHPGIHTPNMARMAEDGALFENTYCPSPLCMPCRSAFVSGRRVHDIQCYNNCNALVEAYPSYGGVLRDAGVHTVHMGKMDVYRPTAELGFTEHAHAGDRRPPGDHNIARRPLAIRADGPSRAAGYGVRDHPFAHDDAVMRLALEWIDSRPRDLAQPWMLSICLHMPHFPHYVTQDLWDLYPDGGDLPEFGPDEESARHPYAEDLRAHFQTGTFGEEDIRGLRRGYLGCVTYIDRQIGRIREALERNGLGGDTAFLYTSDHGEMLGKFGMWWKCSLYEDSARVPLLAVGPGFGPGARIATPVDLHDVRAAMFRALGVDQPRHWLGRPLQDLPANDPDRAVFSEYHGHGTRSGAYMVRKGDWKLIYCMEAPHLLFNLAEDPQELRNRAADHPAKLRELQEELRRLCDPARENRRAEAFIARQLEAMG